MLIICNILNKLLRPSQFLEDLWKFWNSPLCRTKSGPPSNLMLQYIERVAIPNLGSQNCFKHLETTLITLLVSQFM